MLQLYSILCLQAFFVVFKDHNKHVRIWILRVFYQLIESLCCHGYPLIISYCLSFPLDYSLCI